MDEYINKQQTTQSIFISIHFIYNHFYSRHSMNTSDLHVCVCVCVCVRLLCPGRTKMYDLGKEYSRCRLWTDYQVFFYCLMTAAADLAFDKQS